MLVWKKASNGEVPKGAIVCENEENGTPLYVVRENYKGGVHQEKLGLHLE